MFSVNTIWQEGCSSHHTYPKINILATPLVLGSYLMHHMICSLLLECYYGGNKSGACFKEVKCVSTFSVAQTHRN